MLIYCFRRVSSAMLFVLLLSTAVSAQEETRPIRVSAIIISPESHREEKLEDVIKASIFAQLKLDGFIPGELSSSDYIIKISYEIIGTDISISFETKRIKSNGKEIVNKVKWEGPLSLNLDTEIQKVVHTLITRQIEKTVQEEEREPKNKWSLNLGLSGFVPVGESNQIVKLGIGAYVNFGYTILLKKTSLNPSFKVGLIWIPTKSICSGNSTCPSITMVPLVAEIKFSYALNQKLHPYLTGGFGGVWLFRFVHSDKESQANMVPYADAALGIDIRLDEVVGIFVEAGLNNAFERVGTIISNIGNLTGITLNIGIGL
ncbi:hypothetical protein S1OALGB6SA_2305 [Olavius algarvensis spirochete endosymbiont]|uniref:hypothetical protein n=1 Tax=Olavius algarvensis spirochete endosymbiont TaxID=260710 RepID=UPI000F0DC1A1|nr:hypothetical protein [Olavius algarvensis spirochete endosymbiont]CAD7845440.1 MAG: hypothetical protein [Olavius algarvensis spirochete endosymbiont]VDB01204.1 hypothetical protein S1OALGB6SA_2305 [Olavius algarvensis spirochete endosymbiont]